MRSAIGILSVLSKMRGHNSPDVSLNFVNGPMSIEDLPALRLRLSKLQIPLAYTSMEGECLRVHAIPGIAAQ